MPDKILIWLKEKKQSFPFSRKRIMGWGVGAIAGLLLAKYGSAPFLKLIDIPLNTQTTAFFLIPLPIFFMDLVFRTLEKQEQKKAQEREAQEKKAREKEAREKEAKEKEEKMAKKKRLLRNIGIFVFIVLLFLIIDIVDRW